MPTESTHFTREELQCRHCGRCNVSQRLLDALEQLRTLAGVPIHINDACRCWQHNKEVGGVSSSQHLVTDADGHDRECLAADIVIGALTVAQMTELARQVPAIQRGGIGVYPNRIHVDVRLGARPARWSGST